MLSPSFRLFPVIWIAVFLLLLSPVIGAEAAAQFMPDTPDELREQLNEADDLRATGELRSSLSALRSLEREYPENVDVLWRISILWVDLSTEADQSMSEKNFAENALEAAERALEVNSESAWANTARAAAAGQMAMVANSTSDEIDHSRDIEVYAERAIELDPEADVAYHLRGRWHREVSKLGFVQRTVVRAVYGGLPDASIDQAVEDFERAIELEDRSFHHLELARTYVELDRHEDALQALERALESPDTDPFDSIYRSEARDLLEELEG